MNEKQKEVLFIQIGKDLEALRKRISQLEQLLESNGVKTY